VQQKKYTGWIKEAAENTPVLIKITPQVTDIVEVAKAVKKGGADGITASNTIPSLLGIDIYTFEHILLFWCIILFWSIWKCN